MVYRQAAGRQTPDTVLLCAVCAAPTEVVFADAEGGTYECVRCRTEQPVLRAGADTDLRKIEFMHANESKAYEHLAAFAESVGKRVNALEVRVRCDGIECLLSLSLNSGTVDGLELIAHTRGLPAMRFVLEGKDHLEAKEKGLVREVQTGDTAFDKAVYIESAMTDEDIRTTLLDPAVRHAIRELLSLSSAVTIADGRVKVTLRKTDLTFDPIGLRARLGLLRVIAGAPRPRIATKIPEPRAVTLLKRVLYFAAPIPPALWVVAGIYFPTTSKMPALLSAFSGFVVWVLVQPLLTRVLRGRSTSHRELFLARIYTFLFLPGLAIGLLLVANGALDRSPVEHVKMRVAHSSTDSDDSSKMWVDAVEPEGDSHSYAFKTQVADGTALTVPMRAGALGWRWQAGDATIP